MSKIYEYLKNKATDPNYQNKRFYTVNNYYEGKTKTERYTYKDAFEEVNVFIDIYKNNGFDNIKDKIVFLSVSSIMEDIIAMIALMELGAKPILIQKDSLFVFYNTTNNIQNTNFPYDVVPKIIIKDKGVYEINDNILDAYQVTTKCHVVANREDVKRLLSENINIDNLNDNNDFDLALLTSGTTGKKKIVKLNEDILIKKIKSDYELESNELYMCPNPISAISGLIFTAYLPIIANNKSVFVCFYYEDDNVFDDSDYDYDNLNLITATSYFEEQYAQNKYYPALNPIIRSKTNRITLLGSRISTFCYNYLYKTFPRVKKGNIYQYYGRTEDYGLISKVSDKDVSLIYIMQKQIYNDCFYYSLDKKKVLEIKYENGSLITSETDIKFNKDDFIQISNIVDLNKINKNIDITDGLFGEISIDGKETGDFGFKLDNKIYYLCRLNDLVVNINHFNHVNWFEKIYNKELEKIYPNENVQCYCLVENNKFNIYIPCELKKYRNDNFSYNRNKLDPFIKAINYKYINDVILFDKNDLRQGDEIGKFKKYKLYDLKSTCSIRDINSYEDINKHLFEEMKNLLGREINIGYDEKNKIYIFSKKEFSSQELAKIVFNYHVLEFKTDDDNYYLAIDDNFLFAKYDKNIKHQPKDSVDKLKKYIENDEIRGYIVSNFGNVLNQVYIIGTYYNEYNRLTAVVLDEFTFPDEVNIHNPKHDVSKYLSKVKNISRVVVQFSAYNYFTYNYFNDYEFSIDDDNNLYCDNKLYHFTYASADIYGVMNEFLIRTKQELNKGNKPFSKHKK